MHWLSRLLNPRSIAIVGASERSGSLAATTHRQLLDRAYRGAVYAVNPKYESVFGATCYADLAQLPEVPDLVIYAISGLALEASFAQAMSLRVGGVVIYAANYLEDDSEPRLPARLRERAAAAGIPVIGGNSMGFYNYDSGVLVSFDHPPPARPAGHIALVAHSGSGMTYLANNDARFAYNYVISSGQEINASVGDYLDFLLDQPSTRVIAVMLETVRDVPAFVAALRKAQRLSIPVAITRLGRTEQSARLAQSHSGAIVGDHQALVAVCERHGAILCGDIDEMMLTALLFASGRRAAAGGLASMLDSGGMREQMVDLAEHYGIPFASVSPATTAVLAANLEAGLEAVNPMDGMGALGHRSAETFLECGKALLADDDSAMLSFEFEFRDDFSHYPELFEVTRQLVAASDKPVVLVNSFAFSSVGERAAELTREGIPVLNGIDASMRALRNFMGYAQTGAVPEVAAVELPARALSAWSGRLARLDACDEMTSLELMRDFGLPCVACRPAESLAQAREAAAELGYPLVLKTAMPGIAHKSDRNGVIVGIASADQLASAYAELEARLGARVVVMPQVAAGLEVSVGMKNDEQFGPLVVIACGGLLVELLAERAVGLAPLVPAQVDELLERTRLARLLGGVRGQPAADRAALVELVVRFSWIVTELAEVIAEIDLNPVIVGPSGCTIVDALVIPRSES